MVTKEELLLLILFVKMTPAQRKKIRGYMKKLTEKP